MTNILLFCMSRLYTDIIFFWKCSCGSYDVDVNDFVYCFSDCGCSTRNSINSGIFMVPPCVLQTASNIAFFNIILPMWNYLPSKVRYITNKFFLYPIFFLCLKK